MSNIILATHLDIHGQDQWLSGAEALKKAFEEDAIARREFRLDDQDNLADVQARIGNPMPHGQLIEKVRKATGYQVWAEGSINWPGGMNFYAHVGDEKVCLAAAFETDDVLPEFSYVLLDSKGLPCKERRGWRTVLYRVLVNRRKPGVLSWDAMVKEFGDALGQQAYRWRELTRGRR